MKNKTKEIVEKLGTDISGKWMSTDKMDMFTEEIVSECILAIEQTRLDCVRTTYDKDIGDSTKARCIQAIIMKFRE